MNTHPSVQAINSIELVPSIQQPQVLARLSRTIEHAQQVRAAIAYWCVNPDAVNSRLVAELSGDGFLCVDFHLPTDIDILYDMKETGANVYLHLLHPNPQPADLKTHMPDYLLHPKVLLFDLPDEKAELWVGSHNWTARALSGLNIEASVVFLLGREAPLYAVTVQFLEEVRSLCQPFDLSSRSYYKWLQGQASGEPVWVLELEGKLAPNLSGERVTVFETSEDEYKNLRNVDKDLIVSAIEHPAGNNYLYRATITDTGRLGGAGVAFGSRIHGLHTGRGRPHVSGPAVPDASAVGTACAWATVQVKDPLPVAFALFEMPPGERWQIVKDDPFERRVGSEDRRLFLKPGRPLVSHPVPKGVYEGKTGPASEVGMPRLEHALVRRMMIRKPE